MGEKAPIRYHVGWIIKYNALKIKLKLSEFYIRKSVHRFHVCTLFILLIFMFISCI